MKAATPAKMKQVKVMGEVVDDGDGNDTEDKADAYDDWELEDACRTLQRAEEIKADPKMMEALKPHLDKKMKAYKSLSELKQMGAAAKAAGK